MHKLPCELAPVNQGGDLFMAESKNLWGGRFSGKTDPGFAEFNNSFRFDRRLFEVDVVASSAYASALEGAGVLSATEATQVRDALAAILNAACADNAASV